MPARNRQQLVVAENVARHVVQGLHLRYPTWKNERLFGAEERLRIRAKELPRIAGIGHVGSGAFFITDFEDDALDFGSKRRGAGGGLVGLGSTREPDRAAKKESDHPIHDFSIHVSLSFFLVGNQSG
jgi:hypothetical protein